MTLAELIARCRSESEDVTAPYLWSDQEWTAWLNEAEIEACIRARLIEDEAIVAGVTAGDAHIDIPPRAFAVIRVAIVGGGMLELVDRHGLDLSESRNWPDETGDPRKAYRSGNTLRLFPIPATDSTATVAAFCTPATQIEDDDDAPQIDTRLHHHLVEWALRSAYRKPDVDTFDPAAADRHEAEFTRVFGPRPDEVAIRRTRISSRRRTTPQFC